MAESNAESQLLAPPVPDAQDLLDTPTAGAVAIRGGALRVSAYVVGVAVSAGASALLFRHLGVVATGSYVTVVSLVTLTGGVTEAGLAIIGVRELSTLPPDLVRSFFRSLSGLRLAFTTLGIALAVVFALVSGYSSTLVIGTVVAGGGLLLQTAQNTCSLPLLARLRLGWVTVVDLVRLIGTALGVVVLVLAGASLLPFWATTIPGGIAATALAARLIRGSMPLWPSFDRAVWGPLLRRTLPYALATAVGVVYFRLAILIMSLVASGQQTGYFGASFRVVEVLFVIPQLLVGSIFPIFARAARDDRGRLDYALGRMFEVCLLLGLATGLFLATGAEFIIAAIAGPKFAPAAAVLRIEGLALIGSFVGAVFAYGLLSVERYRTVLWINLSVLLLSGVLTTAMAAAGGARGAASATAIVELLYASVLALAVVGSGARPRVSPTGPARAALAALLGALALAPPGLPNVIRPVLAMAIYAAALLALGAVPREILDQIPGLRRPVS